MFWGLKLESGNRYSQLVEKPFHISHAAIAPTTNGSEKGDCPVFPQTVIEVRAIVEKTDYIICYLDPSHGLLQQPLDLNISEGEEIVLYCSCSGHDGINITVYLTGFFVEEPVYNQNLDDLELTNDECSVSDLEDEVEEGEGETWAHQNLAKLLFQGTLDSDESDEEYVVGGKKSLSPVIEEASEESKTEKESKRSKKQTKKRETIQQKRKSGKRKREDSSSGQPEDQPPPDPGSLPSPSKKKKQSSEKKKVKDEPGTQTSRSKTVSKPKNLEEKLEQAQQSSLSPPKKSKTKPIKLKGGTEIQDIEVGSGKVAKPGKRVFVRYTGCLANSKVFDSNVGAPKPFMFKLGQGEVVKGWDDGVQGMQVGGKRKLIVPPKQGYGASGVPPDIPPHAKLLFDIELINVS